MSAVEDLRVFRDFLDAKFPTLVQTWDVRALANSRNRFENICQSLILEFGSISPLYQSAVAVQLVYLLYRLYPTWLPKHIELVCVFASVPGTPRTIEADLKVLQELLCGQNERFGLDMFAYIDCEDGKAQIKVFSRKFARLLSCLVKP